LDGAVAAAVQPDGKIVTAGQAHTAAGADVIISTRMTPSGALDPSYGNGGVETVDIGGGAVGNAIALLPGGKILIAGTGSDSGRLKFAAVRLTSYGQLDPTFGGGGVVTVRIGGAAIANAVAVQRDGKIVLGGTAASSYLQFAAARLNSNGSVDRTFGSGGVTSFGPAAGAWAMALQPDGKIVLHGQTNAPLTSNLLGNLFGFLSKAQAYMTARLMPSGAIDHGFGQSGIVIIPIGAHAFGDALALQPDGKIVVGGSAITSTTQAATLRLMPSGSLDRSFGVGGMSLIPDLNGINAMTLASTGKIILAGVGNSAVRLTTNGSADRTFGAGGIALVGQVQGDAANGVAMQPDGKIILAGVAVRGGQVVLLVTRLNAERPPVVRRLGPEHVSHRWRRAPRARPHRASSRLAPRALCG
jgi:uncharacterized delta-60 repeat protein